jgi:hypothetical protein
MTRGAPVACALAAALLTACGTADSHQPFGKIGGNTMDTESPPIPGSSPSTRGGPGAGILLSHRPGAGRPFRLGDTAAFDACAVLPMAAVREAGIDIDPGESQQVRQDVMERDAGGEPGKSRMLLEGLSNCAWPGVNGQLVVLQMYQPPYSDDRDRTGRLDFLRRKGAKEERVRGLRVFTNHGGDNDAHDWQVSLFADGYWALLLVKTTRSSYSAGSPGEMVGALADRVAENLQRGPTGPSTFTYSGRYADVPDPCTLFTRDDFRRFYGVDDEGRVSLRRTVGEQLLTGDRPGERATYIETSCARKGVGHTFADDDAPGLEVRFQFFPDAEQAALMEYGACDPASSGQIFGPPYPVAAKIGDGRACLPNINREPNRPLVFRAGRTVVWLTNWLYSDTRTPDALAARLTPVAQTIAGRL